MSLQDPWSTVCVRVPKKTYTPNLRAHMTVGKAASKEKKQSRITAKAKTIVSLSV